MSAVQSFAKTDIFRKVTTWAKDLREEKMKPYSPLYTEANAAQLVVSGTLQIVVGLGLGATCQKRQLVASQLLDGTSDLFDGLIQLTLSASGVAIAGLLGYTIITTRM